MRVSRKMILAIMVGLLVFAGASVGVASEVYPSEPIRLIVPYSPGGGTDTSARIVADGMSKYIDEPVIVENRPGASGTVGTLLAAGEKPDGYTILFGIQATMAMNPSLFKAAKYSPDDFDGVALISESPYLITVPGDSPVNNYEDFAKAAQEGMTMANGGSSALLAARLLAKKADLAFTNVPYPGTGAAISDILSGRVDACISSPVSPLSHIKTGALKPILVTGLERFPLLPETPTAAELGFENFKVVGWYGVVAPKGVPRERLDILNEAFNKTVADPVISKKLSDVGVVPFKGGWNVDQVTGFIKQEYDFWSAEIKDAGLKAK
jgi:tripartite-type tricarboxylate transporter receptor subunit TctC